MQESVLLLYKPVSITPYQLIKAYKEKHPQYKNIKMGYAGRLDPMAEGLILVLLGEENKKRKAYEDLPKTYEFTALFGLETDSYDLLGLPKLSSNTTWSNHDTKTIAEYTRSLPGVKTQQYPPYSSKAVLGKPLYKWARDGKLHTIPIPSRKIEIYSISHKKSSGITANDLYEEIVKRITPLQGVFRQDAILSEWKHVFTSIPKETLFHCESFTINCSSGTYIRSLVNKMGDSTGKKAVAFSIKRTYIGEYSLGNAEVL